MYVFICWLVDDDQIEITEICGAGGLQWAAAAIESKSGLQSGGEMKMAGGTERERER